MNNKRYSNNADNERLAWLTTNKFITESEKTFLKDIEGAIATGIALEVGCGEGANIYNLSRSRKIIGVDLNYDKLKLATSVLINTKFVCADALTLPFQNNSFDVVFCKDILHHVSDRDRVFDEMLRVCKPKGKIVIIEANGTNFFWIIFGTIFSSEYGVKKNTILDFERLLKNKHADKLSEINIDFLNTSMLLRLLTHYKFGFKNLGNNKYFLHLSRLFNYFKPCTLKKNWPYIIASATKNEGNTQDKSSSDRHAAGKVFLNTMADRSLRLNLPPKGALTAANPDDPMRYYYHPIVGWLYRARINLGLSLLEYPIEKIIEVGIGSGFLVSTLSIACSHYVGIDLALSPRTATAQFFDKDVLICEADVMHLPFADNSFDALIAFSVFEHLLSLEDALHEVQRVLRPGGQCIIGIPLVSPFMTFLFHAIGFHRASESHRHMVQEVLKALSGYLTIVRIKTLPSFLPCRAALYTCVKALKV